MIAIVGGAYHEICFEPAWNERYGSGLRACYVLRALNPDVELEFYTFADNQMLKHLNLLSSSIRINLHIETIEKSIQFQYDHPMSDPRIYPRLDLIDKSKNKISFKSDKILYYGFIEGSAEIHGGMVVYDPQSPVLPIPFSKTGSTAERLVYVVNYREAILLSGSDNINDIKHFFLEQEKAEVLVLKMGPKGAMVFSHKGVDDIPVYKTPSVWTIGSGDVFAAVFSINWFNGLNIKQSAERASWQTAVYSNSKGFQFSETNSDLSFSALNINVIPKKQLYLAGPFFTFSQRWLINQIYKSLKDLKLNVFSPWHDVGHGIASEVVSKDILALDESGMIFSILDGLDSGTLFEVGYGKKMGIPVIGYVENESSESIKMLEGTSCDLQKDLTTAIYKCFWTMAENE